jgi:hypothetical protein
MVGQPKPLMQLPFYFRLASFGILMADPFARHIAGKFVQFKRECSPVICW